MLIRLGQLAADHPKIRELDINPLLADTTGVVALDARLRVATIGETSAARLAIAPYPQHLESVERLRDGTTLRMRPLRPEDEPLLHDLAAHMNPEDLRLRFFTPVRGLTHAVAARLSQLDYDRELAPKPPAKSIQLAIGQQSAIGGDHRAAELKHQAPVEIEPQRRAVRFTRSGPWLLRSISNKILNLIS